MVTIHSDNNRESFVDFCKREAAGLKLTSDEMHQENREQEELNALQKRRSERKCGDTAVIRSFSGSPLSGGSMATAICPKCKKEILVKNRSFGGYCGLMHTGHDRDIEKVVKSIIAKWTLAEVAYEKNAAEGKDAKWRKVGLKLRDDGEPCNLETMINELKLKEFQHASR
ncbi:hypothetical protein [Fibrobacter sp.]|uniref:hypothetical protein n=1 Tax=Fibrobacter sp. TaxID=35828 RepID=UPI00386E617A